MKWQKFKQSVSKKTEPRAPTAISTVWPVRLQGHRVTPSVSILGQAEGLITPQLAYNFQPRQTGRTHPEDES